MGEGGEDLDKKFLNSVQGRKTQNSPFFKALAFNKVDSVIKQI